MTAGRGRSVFARSPLTRAQDWLEPASIAEQLKTIILPFLNALEHHMSASMFPPLVVAPFSPESGRPGALSSTRLS